MKFRCIVEYEYPVDHKPPVEAEIVLHGDKVVTEDIIPIPEGHWIPSVYKDKRTQKSIQKTFNGICVYTCSNCKVEEFGGNYCSNCGAKMESEVEK